MMTVHSVSKKHPQHFWL